MKKMHLTSARTCGARLLSPANEVAMYLNDSDLYEYDSSVRTFVTYSGLRPTPLRLRVLVTALQRNSFISNCLFYIVSTVLLTRNAICMVQFCIIHKAVCFTGTFESLQYLLILYALHSIPRRAMLSTGSRRTDYNLQATVQSAD